VSEDNHKITLKGVPASPGVQVGKATVLLSPTDAEKMLDGDVLIAPETNPEYNTAILRASAIVTDRGGRLCHAAIVAREMGIPGVVGTQEATKKLKNGIKVEVNGYDGTVTEK